MAAQPNRWRKKAVKIFAPNAQIFEPNAQVFPSFSHQTRKFSHQTRKFFDLEGKKWVKNRKNLQKCEFFYQKCSKMCAF